MILVIGGTGLLGSNLCLELTKSNTKLIATYNRKNSLNKVKKLFQWYFKEEWDFFFNKINWVNIDILDIVSLNNVMKNASYVYHCAALVSFNKYDFNDLMKINGQGTSNVVNSCLNNNIKKLIYVSSTAAVGKIYKDNWCFVQENNKWEDSKNLSSYSISKYTAEKEVWRGIEEGLNAAIINPSIIFGPGFWNESSLSIFNKINDGLAFYTEGHNAFVCVKDVVDSMIFLMNSDILAERFLCTGNNVSFKELFTKIALKLDKNSPRIKASKFISEIVWRMTSILTLFGKKVAITKETARSSNENVFYNSDKLKELRKVDFMNIDDTIDYTIKGRLC